jgi:cell division protein FtsB
VDAGAGIAVVTGVVGLAGLVFTALRWRSDDTKTIVESQSSVLHDMAALNDELRKTAAELRDERDKLRAEVAELRVQVQRLTDELQRLGPTDLGERPDRGAADRPRSRRDRGLGTADP